MDINDNTESLSELLKKVRDDVNNLEDLIDKYLEEGEVGPINEELEELRTSFPSYSAFSELIELVGDEAEENMSNKKRHEKNSGETIRKIIMEDLSIIFEHQCFRESKKKCNKLRNL